MAAKIKTITVTATAPLYEAGTQYKKGDTFETTPERAEALGELVTLTSTADKPAE